ncbi:MULTISPECIES: hypothetical protein [Burkholderia]|uniref:Uncharacterized protein n=1 Tax=Burkholderia lata (strain ATCC 17760 / DSM 23089 / LMG 22485 / NCIMB 9086 / R18194 / 383) TaxID=482957 RepID=A0A6P2JAF0_BURL3|nr:MULTISPECIES: hypothetical protein [Burkholderia]VWB41031.1 hypothetical protein BLA6863_01822 [Burkholderia lata]
MESNGDRTTYEIMKADVLGLYFNFCRDRGLVGRYSHLEVLGYIDYEYDGAFESRLEILMFRVIWLVLSGGWHADLEKTMRDKISNQISTEGLNDLLQGVPADEAELFRHDLRILKFIE